MRNAGAAAGLAVFLRLDSGAPVPLLPERAWDIRRTTGAGIVAVFLMAAATIAFTVYGPLLLNLRFGIGPLAAGYLIALESIAWTAMALMFANLAERWRTLAIRGGMGAGRRHHRHRRHRRRPRRPPGPGRGPGRGPPGLRRLPPRRPRRLARLLAVAVDLCPDYRSDAVDIKPVIEDQPDGFLQEP